MTIKEAIEITGSLSRTSKMPGASYGLPAQRCMTFSPCRDKTSTVCSDCYAARGMYRFPSVKEAQLKRWKSLTHPKWIEGMETQIRAEIRKPEGMWFRWHDSGDVRGAEHLSNIFSLAYRIPEVMFWLPYRIPTLPDMEAIRKKKIDDLLLAIDQWHGIPENLTIRFSSEEFDGVDRLPEALLATGMVPELISMVMDEKPVDGSTYVCPATGKDGTGKCGDCRACWDRDVHLVAYHRH